MFQIVTKLKRIRYALLYWARAGITNSVRRMHEIDQEITNLQATDPTDWATIFSLQEDLAIVAHQEELYWKHQSRVNWLSTGDQNTTLFTILLPNNDKRMPSPPY